MADPTEEQVDELAAALADAFHDIDRPIALGVRDRVAERVLRSPWWQARVDELQAERDKARRFANKLAAASQGFNDALAAVAQKLDAKSRHAAELESALDRIRQLHSQPDGFLAAGKWCPSCGHQEPCPTIRALRGDHRM